MTRFPELKSLVGAILLFVLAGGCGDKETIGICTLNQYTSNDGLTTTTTTYGYVERRLKTEVTSGVGYSSSLTYKYGPDGLLSEATGQINGVTGKILYAHDSIKRLIQVFSLFELDTVFTTHTYNINDQLIKTVTASYLLTGVYDTTILEHTYPDILTKNPSTTVQTHVGDPPVTTSFQYDNKINPFREFFPAIQAYNNIVRIESGSVIYTISYAYNAQGYPISADWSNGFSKTYSYTCE